MRRHTPMFSLAGALAMVALSDDGKILVVDDRERDIARRDYLAVDPGYGAAEAREISSVDIERQRQAAERRARKIARQAKGFAS